MLEARNKHLIIELYLKEKFKDQFNPTWLEQMENYGSLAAAIEYFYHLNNDNLNIAAIASDDFKTRALHEGQFNILVRLLDKLVDFNNESPPIATIFHEKEAVLVGIELNLGLKTCSLRDLHAQSSNLGIAEKLLNEELGQTEWLGEVDLERLLIKLGVKNRVHITRLNAEDIGMILHFERAKHQDSLEPYTIPLLINCGGSASIRSQGSHWTYAMIRVDPTARSVTLDYQDSMPLSEREQSTLSDAINYREEDYTAFPDYKTKTVHVSTNDLQKDGWSCGYRALHSLLKTPGFPIDDELDLGDDWQRFINTETDSYALRNVIYELLLSNLEINPDYFVAMRLNSEMVQSYSSVEEKTAYALNSKFIQDYFELLKRVNQPETLITTDHFKDEYQRICELLMSVRINTDRKDSLKRLNEGIKNLMKNDSLSPDAKVIALFEVFSSEYALILNSVGGANSELGKFINDFCIKNLGVKFGKDSLYHLNRDGLMMRIINDQLGERPQVTKEESLLPPIPIKSPELHQISKSAPIFGKAKKIEPHITPSAGIIGREKTEAGQPVLRKNTEFSRVGSMFGPTQFCYAEKPSGVEPGFRAVDLNEMFFKELDKILADECLPSKKQMLDTERQKLILLREILKPTVLSRKQLAFSTFINTYVPGPHAKGAITPSVQWLGDRIKEAVATNNQLSAWMYKLDYAEGEKNRIKGNKEAIREFVGTRLAGVFSAQNQKQEIIWLNNGNKGVHAVLACGWKNGLQQLKDFLHGGNAPDYNGVLVEHKEASVKYSKFVPGLGMNLIFGIAIGDRDGMGKEAQNKGIADGAFYGFDYGKTYDGTGVCATIDDDFSFEDKFAKTPSIFRSSKIGIARHFMYRNYSVFYDTDLSERMFGLHLLRKMITGENPGEDVIKSFPGLRQELHRIEENTPASRDLLMQFDDLRSRCSNSGQLQALIDKQMMQICTGKLSNFDLYFAKIKAELMDMSIKNPMSVEELTGYMEFIDGMMVTAHNNNKQILSKFEQRALLTKQEIDFLDHLEKYISPTSVMSHDGEVFLRTMRFDPQSGRIPFGLKMEENGTYTLSTANTTINRQLNEEFGLECTKDDKGLSFTITSEKMLKLADDVEAKYQQKRDKLLIKRTYQFVTLPQLSFLLNKNNESESEKMKVEFLWQDDNSLSLRLMAKTKIQAQMIKHSFGIKPTLHSAELIEIPQKGLIEFQKFIAKVYEKEPISELKSTDQEKPKESLFSFLSHMGLPLIPISKKWHDLYDKVEDKPLEKPLLTDLLIMRFASLISNAFVLKKVTDVIMETAHPEMIQKLMQYTDKTLSFPSNIQAIIDENFDNIKVIAEELDESMDTPSFSSDMQKSFF